MLANRYMKTSSQAQMLDPNWVQSIRDRDFLLIHAADIPRQLRETLNRIEDRLNQDAWELTKVLFPSSIQDELGWIEIEGNMMILLSTRWWELVEQKLAEGGVR